MSFLRTVYAAILLVLCMPAMAIAQTGADMRGDVGGSGIDGGSIIPGYDSRTCDGTIEGAIRYNSGASSPEYCDGATWVRTGVGALGSCGQVNCGGSSNEKVAFVTSSTYNGNLGGISGADAKCASAATGAGLSGTYLAWIALVDDSYNPNIGFTQATIPYELVDGTQIADNYTDLTDDGSLVAGDGIDALLNLDENGSVVKNDYVWSDVEADGTRISATAGTDTCSDWTDGTASSTARIGSTGAMYRDWTAIYGGDLFDCDQTLHLYCFEQ